MRGVAPTKAIMGGAGGVVSANPIEDSDQKLVFPSLANQFEYFDISGNTILMDNPVCRFFLSS